MKSGARFDASELAALTRDGCPCEAFPGRAEECRRNQGSRAKIRGYSELHNRASSRRRGSAAMCADDGELRAMDHARAYLRRCASGAARRVSGGLRGSKQQPAGRIHHSLYDRRICWLHSDRLRGSSLAQPGVRLGSHPLRGAEDLPGEAKCVYVRLVFQFGCAAALPPARLRSRRRDQGLRRLWPFGDSPAKNDWAAEGLEARLSPSLFDQRPKRVSRKDVEEHEARYASFVGIGTRTTVGHTRPCE